MTREVNAFRVCVTNLYIYILLVLLVSINSGTKSATLHGQNVPHCVIILKGILQRVGVEVKKFLMVDKGLLSMKEFVSLDGEVVVLSLTDKVVYSYMKDRWEFFKERKEEYYDSLEDIGEALGVHRKTVARSVSKMEALGVLSKVKKKIRGYDSNVYTRIGGLYSRQIKKKDAKESPDSHSCVLEDSPF